MNEISAFLRRAVFWGVGLLLMLAGAVFAASLFLAVLLIAAFGTLGALLSGRKPEPFVIWSRWREMQARNRFTERARGFSDAGRSARARADVVDVQARDVDDARPVDPPPAAPR